MGGEFLARGVLGSILLLAATSLAFGDAPDEHPAEPVVAAIDLYGTSQIAVADIEDRVGAAIREMVRLRATDQDLSKSLKDEIVRTVESMGDFAWVGLGVVTYFQPEAVYVTVDVVDASEGETRMPFHDAPTGDVMEDPADLVAAMTAYLDTGFEMMRSGEIKPARVECPAYHCVFGFEHPRLEPFGDRFANEVPEHHDDLVTLLESSSDPEQRAQSAFLLAHLPDGDEVVDLMIPAILDPDATVRNNAMRVLSEIAWRHPEVEIPVDPILTALTFPATTDRNKASAILAGLAEREKYRDAIVGRAGPVLLEMLRLRQPNNHDFAYKILKSVSGKEFGERDYASWQAWLDAAAAADVPEQP